MAALSKGVIMKKSLLRCATGLIALLFVGLCGPLGAMSAAVDQSGIAPSSAVADVARAHDAFQKLPLAFEQNVGQMDPTVRFLSRGSGFGIFLTDNEAVLAVGQGKTGAGTLRMQLLGTNSGAAIAGEEILPAKSNYYRGNKESGWVTGASNYSRVKYSGLYNGIDLVYYGKQRQLEYDFLVAPNANPADIRLSFSGAEKAEIAGSGSLILRAGGQDVVFQKPVAYQQIDGARRDVPCSYILSNGQNGAQMLSFAVGAYDAGKPLVIDPVLAYSSYLGGTAYDGAVNVALDASGNIFVVGNTLSVDFPLQSAAQNTHGAGDCDGEICMDAFVTKMDATGTSLVFSTFLGGTLTDYAGGVGTDSTGNAYVVGYTSSTDFPTKSPTQAANAGGFDAFVTKLDTAGALVFSTYFGGSGDDKANEAAVGSASRVFFVGSTSSVDFPVTPNAIKSTLEGGCEDVCGDGFVTEFDASGAKLFSTYLGGSSEDVAYGVALDTTGAMYVTGGTSSADFPTSAGAFHTALNGEYNAFVTKIDGIAYTISYSTFLGGSSDDKGYSIAVDSSNVAYVGGLTTSSDFPLQSALKSTLGGLEDGFVTKVSASGAALLFSTYVGGSQNDEVNGIAVDGSGVFYAAGWTQSADLPVVNYLEDQGSYHSGEDCSEDWPCADAFVAAYKADASGYSYLTYLGGTKGDNAYGIAVTSDGVAYVTGVTGSADFPITATAYQNEMKGVSDAFVSIISGELAAGFSGDPTEGTVPLLVTFTDESSAGAGIVSWAWDFGDGCTSTEENPTHTYTAGGSYTVVLTITDVTGATSVRTRSDYITASWPPPEAKFSGTPRSGYAPVTVEFTDNSSVGSGIVSWAWDFGDGKTSSAKNPTHKFSEYGKYCVTLTVTDSVGATSTLTKDNYVNVKAVNPKASFTGTPRKGTAPVTVKFTNSTTGTVDSWLWQFGDGKTSTKKAPSHKYTKAGKYTVKLTATGPTGKKSTQVRSSYVVVVK